MNYSRSSALFQQAKKYIPGGVNSPVRAFKAVGGDPVFIESAKGAYLYDADGNQLIDYIASWGPMILGHAHDDVLEPMIQRAQKGTSFGTPTQLETRIAELAVNMVPHIDQIRFVNSGTEACMSAVRLARGFTGKEKLIKFSGCYHGHSDAFLIQAGSGALTFGSPNSPGVTQGTAKDTLLARFNDLDSVQQLVDQNPDQIAAIIVEPVAGNMGCILPQNGFLEGLRRICDNTGILLIFDEVMTGFRLARGGAQERLGIRADITTFGKVIGGGLPVGAFAARQEIMNYLAPVGPVYQAGTLSGNPLAMSAGLATLSILNDHPEVYSSLDEKTAYLHRGLESHFSRHQIPYQINRLGSMISVHFSDEPVVDFESSAQAAAGDSFSRFFRGMLDRGIYLPPSAFESWFLNNALSYEDLDKTIQACGEILDSWS